MNIEIYKGKIKLEYKRFIFPAGEVGIKLDINRNFCLDGPAYKIVARVQNSDDVIAIAMIKNAIEEFYSQEDLPMPDFLLYLTYLPYGRQDRVCDKGESFSLKVFANFINSLNFDRVYLFDPHSDVAGALFNNVKIIKQVDIVKGFCEIATKYGNNRGLLISPDAGSNKKTSEIAKWLSNNRFIRADKLRDLSNGNILETIVYTEDLRESNVLIVDDLCDGGRTFTELAKALKNKNCGKVALYVTHGIFSKGTDTLFNNGIDEIYTTNSYPNRWDLETKIHILELEEAFIL